jgi:squalene-hopene/tetraprenyl-beta-curcumene cyclase
VLIDSATRVQPVAPPAQTELAGDLEAAVSRAQENLFKLQKPDGYWVGELMVDSTLVSDMVAYHHWAGKIDREWQRKAVNHIFSMQLSDGGWNIYHGGPSEVNATIKAYLALKLAGVAITDPRMLKAREVALNFGGVPRMNTFSKLYLALLGLFPWQYVPTIPCEVLLIGKWFHVNFWDMSNWSRGMLVPLSIINHFKPTRPASVSLDELYPAGIHERDFAPARDPQRFTLRNFFLWLDSLHKFAERFARRGVHPFRKRALKRAEQWMLERFEGSDGLAAIFPAMLNSLIALKALGYADDHPQVVRAAHELNKLEHEEKDSVRIEPCFSPVWDTAIVVMCLAESGISESDPRLKRAAEWLMEKEIRFAGDWVHKNPAKVEPSGWVFEYNNQWNPDVDDTAMVLLALRKIPTDNPQKRDECFPARTEVDADLPVQGRRLGGVRQGLHQKHPGEGALCRPQRHARPRVRRHHGAHFGIARLRKMEPRKSTGQGRAAIPPQAAGGQDGSWYGRWGVNYIYGTWQVLRGLRAMNLNMNQPWLLRARAWLESVQHEDGGWGERCNTYDDPVFKGQGPSTASQTAWAVMGLCAFDDPENPALKRGVEYLVRTQNPDGSWTEHETTGTGFPESVLFEIRHVPERLAAAGARDVSEYSEPRRHREKRRGPCPCLSKTSPSSPTSATPTCISASCCARRKSRRSSSRGSLRTSAFCR